MPSKLFPHTTQVKHLGWYGLPVARKICEWKKNKFSKLDVKKQIKTDISPALIKQIL